MRSHYISIVVFCQHLLMIYINLSVGYTTSKEVILMNNFNIEVGKRITELRQQRGYTREKLSELAEVSVQFLADIEKGRKSMTIATLKRISSALLVTTDYLVNGNTTSDDNSQIISILNTLSEKNKKQAEKILTAFAEAVNSTER